jgi:hemolysin activation/secretion protein
MYRTNWRRFAWPVALLSSVGARAGVPVDAPPAALDIWEFVVDGNTVLSAELIERAVAPFMGPERRIEDVDAARAALEGAYREQGYRTVAVSIPRQAPADGVIRLEVVEGRVGHLNVRGSRYHSLERVKESAPSVAEGAVPDFDLLQEDLVALNRQPDRRVTPALKSGRRPGTVDVDLMVDDALPLHGWLELNNRYSQDTSELRATATLSYDNLWQRGHGLSLSFQTAPQETDDAKVMFGSYTARLDDSPWSLLFNALDSDSDVSTVGGINVLGNGQVFGLWAIREVEGGEGFYPSLSLGLGYKDFETTTLLGGDDFLTPVHYYPLAVGYTALWRGESQQSQLDVSLNFASPQLGSNTRTIQLNRYAARGQMFWLRTSLAHTRDIGEGYQIHGRLGLQLTDQPLISNEQLSAGGMDTVRGYLEAEALGDWGAVGAIELRSPPLQRHFSPGGSTPFDELRLFGFVDAAELRLNGPHPDDSTPESTQLLGVGAGLELKLHDYVNGVLDWAHALQNGPGTDAGSDRVLFRVWTSF